MATKTWRVARSKNENFCIFFHSEFLTRIFCSVLDLRSQFPLAISPHLYYLRTSPGRTLHLEMRVRKEAGRSGTRKVVSLQRPSIYSVKTAIVDIDNTLWQFCDAFYEELQKINGAFPPVEQWDTWDFYTPYCTEQEFLGAVDAVHERQDSEAYRPYPEAKGFLRTLNEQGYRIVIASHRRPEMRAPTERWLRKHDLIFDDLHLSFNKTVLFGEASVVVDDAPHTLEKAVEHKAVGAGLLFPWNKTYAGNGFGLFRNLNEVLGYIGERSSKK